MFLVTSSTNYKYLKVLRKNITQKLYITIKILITHIYCFFYNGNTEKKQGVILFYIIKLSVIEMH